MNTPVDLVGPVGIGGRRAPSRVLFGPHETNLGYRREISERHVAYYARRAVGGAGVIVTEVASVHPSDHPYERAPLAADCGPGWAAVAGACHRHGALVLAGLGHAGGQGSTAFSRTPLWGPSRVPDVVTREVPMVMERPEIDALVDGFAAAARGAVAAGLDGVEIDAGQYSLLRQFCSGLTNHRIDAYGTDRGRLLREVLTAVRDALGGGVLGLRLCVDELAPWAGITPDAGAELAGSVSDLVDHLVPVRGSALSVSATRPDLHTPPGFQRATCRAVRVALRQTASTARAAGDPVSAPPVSVPLVSASPVSAPPDSAPSSFDARPARAGSGPPPVVLQGSVVDPAMAAAALADGTADLVEMTRAQIADPDLVRLLRAGTPERIRPCTLSNQLSRARDPRNPIVGDEAEPRSGHESTDPPVEGRDPVPREVLVVGGGPAGLEAARTLALRGHRVRLHERDHVLGGALRPAAAVHGRERLGVLVAWWERELARLGVDVRLGAEVTVDDLDAAERAGAAVLLATGSRPAPPAFASAVPVLTAAEFERTVARTGSTPAALATHAPVAAPRGPAPHTGSTPAAPATYAPAAAPRGSAPHPSERVRELYTGCGSRRWPRRVVVVDPVGDWVGVGIAEQLATAGVACALVTPDAVAGDQLARTGDLADANARLERAGVTRELFSLLRSVAAAAPDDADLAEAAPGGVALGGAALGDAGRGAGVAVLEDVHTGAVREIACDLVLDCSARLPEETLWTAGPHRWRAGDCVAPRTVAEAVREGRRAALSIAVGPPPVGLPSAGVPAVGAPPADPLAAGASPTGTTPTGAPAPDASATEAPAAGATGSAR